MEDMVRDLLERIRSTAHEAADVAAEAGRKAGQMVDTAKLNVQLYDLNSQRDEVLRQLGQVMYDTHLGQLPDGDPVTPLLEQADDLSGRVEELKTRMAELRRSRTCPDCGALCGRDDKYCRHCGKSL